MNSLNPKLEGNGYKFENLRKEIIRCIEQGVFKNDEPMPSISELSRFYGFSEVTVRRVYGSLKRDGYILSSKGRFFIKKDKSNRLKVLLIFNTLNQYKKILYDSILENFPAKTKLDLQIYYYDYKVFKEIINENLGLYDYYIVMPHFHHNVDLEDCKRLLTKIPRNQLFLVDKRIPGVERLYPAVYQDFETDLSTALEKITFQIQKYNEIRLCISNSSHHPLEVINGALKFCKKTDKKFQLIENIENESIRSNALYIVTMEEDMAKLMMKIRKSIYRLGHDIGLISYNETIFKELLNITVFSTNFYEMGKHISDMVVNQRYEQIKNPFDIIIRDSI